MTSREYPLATKDGIETFVRILIAGQTWRSATPRQRELILDTCAPLLQRIREARAAGQGPVVLDTTPVIAGVGLNTLRSMRAKGLIDDTGRLTYDAIEAAYWQTKEEAG